MKFREKLSWASLLATLSTASTYACLVPSHSSTTSSWLWLLGLAFIVQVTILTATAFVLAWRKRPEPTDESDRQIDRTAGRIAYFVLAFGLVALGGYFVAAALLSKVPDPDVAVPMATTIGITHTILGFVFTAECVRWIAQIVLYRRGR